MNYKKILLLIILLLIVSINALAVFSEPFKWDTQYTNKNNTLKVSVHIDKNHYLYSEQTHVTVITKNKKIPPIQEPKTESYKDENGSHQIYSGGQTIHWLYSLKQNMQYKVILEYQGCKKATDDTPSMCLIPAMKTIIIDTGKQDKKNQVNAEDKQFQKLSKPTSAATHITDLDTLLNKFETIKTGGGYLPPEDFLAFLNFSKAKNNNNTSTFGNLPVKSILGLILFIILGGLALNLTPCILPMIPVNLAIIGAGSTSKSKYQGFIRGGIYGLGIAVAYGILGVFAVVTGSKFGSLNSSPEFNYAIAAIFLILALAMFDIISIDFSRFNTVLKKEKQSEKIQLLAVFSMGVIAALLAGACVAPVIIAVLLYSATVYTDGNVFGILLPFLLGIGMALPWPFAGAGIAMLPKPGIWMLKVKYIFGILILIFAGYYFYVGTTLNSTAEETGSSFENLQKKLKEAKKLNKPVFIDFWATWCSNCKKMEHNTFQKTQVKNRLKDFVFIKFQAENINDPKIKALLDRFKIPGLPGFVILKLKEKRNYFTVNKI